MNRNNTSFQSKLYDALRDAMDTSELPDKLLYYQRLSILYMHMSVSKGLFINYSPGLGKTMPSVAIAHKLHEEGHKVIILTPKSLQANYKGGVLKYNELMKASGAREVDPKIFNYTIKSKTINRNIAKILNLDDVFENDRTPMTLKKITHKVVFIIDEAHGILQRIAHGSPYWVQFYDLIMASPLAKLVMLSGSLFSANPFELAVGCNMLSGQRIFPEYERDFAELFWNAETAKVRNRGKFQNRIYGLFSKIEPTYLEAETVNFYPKDMPTEVIECPMSEAQFASYLQARSREIKESIKGESRASSISYRFGSAKSSSTTYRVRSRQYSNMPASPEILELYRLQKYTKEQLHEELGKIKSVYLDTPKFEAVLKVIQKHKGRKGIIYSQFTGVGGTGALGEFLKRKGITNFEEVNGSYSAEEQAKTVIRFNSATNDDGSDIRLLLIGLEQCVGLDLECAEFAIMLEPYWLWFVFAQLKKRINRYKSHMRLKPERRLTYSYIMISTYPTNMDKTIKESRGMRQTTDEKLYSLMLSDKERLEQFEQMVAEVAIECIFIKEKNPEHICRVCAPDNKPLFTYNERDSIELLKHDCSKTDPCDLSVREEIPATKIVVGDIEYFLINDEGENHVYIKVGNEYEEVPRNSITYDEVILSSQMAAPIAQSKPAASQPTNAK